MMIAGEASFGSGGWAGTPVSTLLPCVVSAGNAPLTGDFAVEVPPAAKGSPLIEPLETPAASGALHHFELLHVTAARPGAETALAVRKDAPAAGAPALLTMAAGRGRTAALLGLPTYHWRALPGDAHGAFWRGLLRHLAGKERLKKGEGGILLDVPKPEFTLGETVPLSARVRDRAGVLSDVADVSVNWTRSESSDAGVIRLASVGGGEYRATFTPPAVGAYTLNASASVGSDSLPPVSVAFNVGRKDLEFERIGLNREMLQSLAARSGGVYVSIESVDVLARSLVEHSEIRERRTTLNPARSWITFLILVLLVSFEWYTRRRLELA